MSKFEKFTLCHLSNGSIVQDGFDTYAIRENGTEVWAATTGETLSKLQVEIADADVKRAAQKLDWDASVTPPVGDIVEIVGTPVTRSMRFTPARLNSLRTHVGFTGDMTEEETINYLWDVIKMLSSVQEPK